MFVTGQQEVNVLCNKLQKLFPYNPNSTNQQSTTTTSNRKQRKQLKETQIDKKLTLLDAPTVNLDNYSTMPLDEQSDIFDSTNVDDGNDDEDMDKFYDLEDNDDDEDDDSDLENPLNDKTNIRTTNSNNKQEKPLYVLPLYSLLSSEKQIRVFDKVPDNCRLCVVATNVAETSLTIPNIKYVVDTGKVNFLFFFCLYFYFSVRNHKSF